MGIMVDSLLWGIAGFMSSTVGTVMGITFPNHNSNSYYRDLTFC